MQFKFISIEGNIGSGKTSLSEKIAKYFNARLILEKFADNPFLPDFYKNPEQNAFPLELFFMAERFQQLSNEFKYPDLFSFLTVSDYYFVKSNLFAQNNLKEKELILFNRLFDIMLSSIRKPDLLIYLHSDIERIQQNIEKRGREFEQNISDRYLKDIELKYFDFLKKQNDFPVLILDATKVNFVKDESVFKNIISEINNMSNEKTLKKVILI